MRLLCVLENLLEIIFDCLIYYRNCYIEIKDVKEILIFMYNRLWNFFSILESKFREVSLYKLFDGILINFDRLGVVIVIKVGCILISGLELFC